MEELPEMFDTGTLGSSRDLTLEATGPNLIAGVSLCLPQMLERMSSDGGKL